MYRPIITHDIDRLYKWKKSKSIYGEVLRKTKKKSSWKWEEMWSSYKMRKRQDPFSNLKQIADYNANAGIKSVFYIMTSEERHEKNINDYHVSEIKEDLNYILEKGAEIGLHPGILTYNNIDLLQKQKNSLEAIIGRPVTRSRQHYLKYSNPETFQNLKAVGIVNDSSIYPTDKSDTYMMTDEDGNEIGVTQTPLVFMDTHHMFDSDEQILSRLEESLAPAKKDGGEVMVLWHNNNISNDREKGLYKEALQVIKSI